MARGRFADKLMVVVDDDQDAVDLARELLRLLGIGATLGFTDVDEAFDALATRHVDAAVFDHLMPGTDGIALARRVRASDRVVNAVMPIVLVTSQPAVGTIERAIREGIDEVLAKPFSQRTLHMRVAAVFDSPRTYIRTPAGYFGPDRRRRLGTAADRRDPDAALFAGGEPVTREQLLERRQAARMKYGRVPPSPLEPPPPVLTGPVTRIPVVRPDPASGRAGSVLVPTALRREIAAVLAEREKTAAADDDVHMLD